MKESLRVKGLADLESFPCPDCRQTGAVLKAKGMSWDAGLLEAQGSSQASDSPAPVALAPVAPMSPAPTQDPSSPVQSTQGGRPLPRLADDEWRFAFADVTKKALDVAMSDPIVSMMSDVKSAPDIAALRRLIHPPELFSGFANAQETYSTTYQWIEEIVAAAESNRALAARARDFPLRLLCPVPYRKAIGAIALRQGWPQEAVLQGLLVNVNWLEHHGTRLVDCPFAEHKRSTTIAAFFGAPPSVRKSSLRKFISTSLLSVPGMPEDLKEGNTTCNDGTVKGLKTAMQTYGRGGYDTDEVSLCYATSLSSGESGKGLHHANKASILPYVNGERIATLTGIGAVHLTKYAFRHYVMGQVEAVESVLSTSKGDTSFGFPKRFHEVWASDVDVEFEQQCEPSIAFLKGLHQWLALNTLPKEAEHYPDGFATDMLRAMLRACSDYLTANPGLNKLMVEKLLYADSDLHRLANAQMRLCQHCEDLAPYEKSTPPSNRVTWSCWELAHAAHNWRRQLAFHFGHYGPAAVESPNVPSDALSADQQLQRLILRNRRCTGSVTTSAMREALKRTLKGSYKNLSKAVVEAVNDLAAAGVVEVMETLDTPEAAAEPGVENDDDDEEPRRKNRGGWAVKTFRKRTWEQIQGDSDARGRVAALRLGADSFDN